MQQMNPEETKSGWRDSSGGYGGYAEYSDRSASSSGQKLNHDSDEQFAEILTRKIKRELKVELQAGSSLGYRVALGIVSVCMLVPLFGLLIWAISLNPDTNASIALGWGFATVCGVIFAVNGYFNWASTVISRNKAVQKSENKKL